MPSENCKTIRIVSNADGTRVYDAVTGEEIKGVTAIDFGVNAVDRVPFAKVSVEYPEIDITCDAHVEAVKPNNLPSNDLYKLTGNFATVMRNRMISAHRRGKSGWRQINPELLLDALIKNLKQGDMVDVANYAMMLYHSSASQHIFDEIKIKND